MLSTREAAEYLQTTPKTLRQFLRADDTFEAVGSGSRYGIEQHDLPRLKKRFDAWASKKKGVWAIDANAADNEGQPGLPASILGRRDRATRELVAKRAEERVDRLEALLKSKGLHISQMKRPEPAVAYEAEDMVG